MVVTTQERDKIPKRQYQPDHQHRDHTHLPKMMRRQVD
jgi:hypothetical protein